MPTRQAWNCMQRAGQIPTDVGVRVFLTKCCHLRHHCCNACLEPGSAHPLSDRQKITIGEKIPSLASSRIREGWKGKLEYDKNINTLKIDRINSFVTTVLWYTKPRKSKAQ